MLERFTQRVDIFLKQYPEDFKKYLKASYYSRSTLFMQENQNEYQSDPTLIGKNKTVLRNKFPLINEEIIRTCQTIICHRVEYLDDEKVELILKQQEQRKKNRKMKAKQLKKQHFDFGSSTKQDGNKQKDKDKDKDNIFSLKDVPKQSSNKKKQQEQ